MTPQEARKNTRSEWLRSGILRIDSSSLACLPRDKAPSILVICATPQLNSGLLVSFQPVDEIDGFFENRSMSSGIGAQGCALSSQIAMDGRKLAGSSRLAAVTANMFSVQAKSGDPHSAQNSRVSVLPLSVFTA
jgi:hypothetical protein